MKRESREPVRAFRRSLRRLERVQKVLMEEKDCCGGLTLSQCHPLLEIEERGETGLNDLAARLGLDPSTLSRTIEGLVRLGMVDRRPNPKDRRSVILTLTRRGKTTCDAINEKNDRLYDEILSRLTKRRREEALVLFDELVRAMDEAIGSSEASCCTDSE